MYQAKKLWNTNFAYWISVFYHFSLFHLFCLDRIVSKRTIWNQEVQYFDILVVWLTGTQQVFKTAGCHEFQEKQSFFTNWY